MGAVPFEHIVEDVVEGEVADLALVVAATDDGVIVVVQPAVLVAVGAGGDVDGVTSVVHLGA
jgi:hypothetical protein